MNIIVQCFDHHIVFRPDTSRKRDEDDLYVPDYCTRLEYAPVVYIKMDRPGKCIAERFASRYYSTAGYGILLYPGDLMDGSPQGYASAICVDRMSCLPATMMDIHQLDNGFTLYRSRNCTLARSFTKFNDSSYLQGSKSLDSCNNSDKLVIYKHNDFCIDLINRAVENASSRCFLRTGDILAVELAAPAPLCCKEDGKVQLCADGSALEFEIVF